MFCQGVETLALLKVDGLPALFLEGTASAVSRDHMKDPTLTEGTGMAKIPQELRTIIANNIRLCRMRAFPGHGGAKKCAEAIGVSPQQWSPWERGFHTPDEMRLKQIADFFNVSVEYMRQSHTLEEVLNPFTRISPPAHPAIMRPCRYSVTPNEVLDDIVHITRSVEYALHALSVLKDKLSNG
ncbi:MAG: helix-turn-helix domain-containing protein [Planctomycetes bacterium]|nr:helix-turn-helix domain-containing protein [Planctomycetota bacterium]